MIWYSWLLLLSFFVWIHYLWALCLEYRRTSVLPCHLQRFSIASGANRNIDPERGIRDLSLFVLKNLQVFLMQNYLFFYFTHDVLSYVLYGSTFNLICLFCQRIRESDLNQDFITSNQIPWEIENINLIKITSVHFAETGYQTIFQW